MMKELLAHATTEELYKLADTIVTGEDLTDEQAALLDDVGAELENRGEWKKISMDEAEALGEQIRQRAAAEQTRAETDKETPPWLAQLLQDAEEDVRQRKAKRRKVTVAAAGLVVVLLVSNSISAWAGFDFFAWAFARVQHGFHMITAGESLEEGKIGSFEYRQVNETLNMRNVSVKIPTWIPVKYHFQEFNDTDTADPFYMTAWFSDGERQFSLQIREAGSQEELDSWMETNEDSSMGSVEHRVIAGVSYAITVNKSRVVAIWYERDYELMIQGDLTAEQVIKMLESI
jgi:hypothetical protein